MHDMQKKKKNAAKAFFRTVFISFIVAVIGVAILVSLVNRYYPLRYVDIVNRYAEMYDLEAELIFAVIHTESRFNSDAVSRVGASGLMQIMESTAYWIAPQIGLEGFSYETQIFDPEINIHMGTFYLNMHIDRFGDIDVALAAYNAGQGNVHTWLSDPELSSDGETLDRIPFAETEKYISRVANSQRIYNIVLRFENVFRRD